MKGCCWISMAAAMVPVAVIVAVLLESPQVTKLDVLEQVAAHGPTHGHDLGGAGSEEVSDVTAQGERSTGTTADGPRLGSGGMFDRIAFAYDVTNKWMSFGLDQFWRQTLVKDCLRVERDDRVLDLATGTADVALLAGERLRRLSEGRVAANAVWGLDPSSEMLRRGVTKVEDRGFKGFVRLVKGDAQDLSVVRDIDAAGTLAEPTAGLANSTVDKISMSFGIRNVPDRGKALREMKRVLRSRESSRVCILEFSLPSGETLLSRIARLFITHVVPAIGGIATGGSGSKEYQYLERSILNFPQPLDFAASMAKEGLPVHSITSFAFGAVHLYSAGPISR